MGVRGVVGGEEPDPLEVIGVHGGGALHVEGLRAEHQGFLQGTVGGVLGATAAAGAGGVGIAEVSVEDGGRVFN